MTKRRSIFPGVCWTPLVFLLLVGASRVSAESTYQVTIEATDHGAVILVDGQPFAEYLVSSGHQPVVWPLVGPTGKPMTRSFPVGPLQPGEKNDHPHHRSLWFSHGDVNGIDFWNLRTAEDESKQIEIQHRTFDRMEADGNKAVIVTVNDWNSPDGKVCEDRRVIAFGADESHRWIDFSVQLTASDGEIKLGDTKEGTFGVRVAGTMKVDAGLGGRILNSRGDTDGAAWGRMAEWVDYQGPVDDETLNITVIQHPTSFRYPSRWHVRTYGLFAANPFGEKDFPGPRSNQGEVTLAHGESIELHYRVLLHGALGDEEIARLSDEFSATNPPEFATGNVSGK